MTRFNKAYCSPAQLVQVLKSRGLEISDEDRAERYINNIGYYRLSAYMYPFLKEPKTDHRFKDNVSFDRVLRLYRFDKKLRMLLFNEIEKIEIAFRQTVANVTAQMSGNIFWMTDVSSYSKSSKAAKSITLITNEYNKSREDFIEHFKRTYTDPFPPAWISSTTNKRRIYYNICIIKYFLDIISPNNDFKDKLTGILNLFPEIDLRAMGFNANWEQEPLWK